MLDISSDTSYALDMEQKLNHGFGKRNAAGEVTSVRREDVVSPAFHAAIEAVREAKERNSVSPIRWMIRLALFIILLTQITELLK